MPRANRTFIPGHVWHLTQRCHKREFLLKFVRDRRCWLRWLFEARKRYKLCILNYVVTSNHIHLLVMDVGNNAISGSMQLAAGQTAQRYNKRKGRKGAFWEDRYHATAVQTDDHLLQCIVYIDLNMVRAGVVKHPSDWPHSGYREIQTPPERYSLIDMRALASLCGFQRIADLQIAHNQWVDAALVNGDICRESRWTENKAVGTEEFIIRFDGEPIDDDFRVKEAAISYGVGNETKIGLLSTELASIGLA